MAKQRRLTLKQQAFCKEYTTNGGNATKAHQAAYGQQSCNMVEGCRNLVKPKIKVEIDRIIENKEHKQGVQQEITREYICSELQLQLDGAKQVKDRPAALKAIELLGKTRGIFKEGLEVTDVIRQQELDQAEIEECRALAKLRLKQITA